MTDTNELDDHFVNWAADLTHTMGAASKHFKSSDDIQHQREVLRNFILDLTELLRIFPIAEKDLVVLKFLSVPLFDLASGIQSPLFVVSKSGRPKSRAEVKMLRARAVSYVMLLRYHGINAKDAETEVGRVLSKAGHRGRNGGDINRDLIHKWFVSATPAFRKEEHALAMHYVEEFRSDHEDTLVKVRNSLATHPIIHKKKVVKPL